MKKILGFVAMVLAIAACNTMEMDNQPTGKDGMITITAQLAPKTAMTKALAFGKDAGDNDIIVSTWAVGDHLAICYYKPGNKLYAADAEITQVHGSGAATIAFDVEADTPDGTNCTIIYPYSARKDGSVTVKDPSVLLALQNGKLDATENPYLDVRVGEGVIHTSPATLDVTTQPAAQYSIFKFTTQDLNGIDLADNNTKSITKFNVFDANDNEITSFTPNTTSNILYVALPAMNAGSYWFFATIKNTGYYGTTYKYYTAKATIEVATNSGLFYQTTMKMATVGNVIASDGKFYYNQDATPGGNTAVAKIAFVGVQPGLTNEAKPYNHGLALALSNANGGEECYWRNGSAQNEHTTRQNYKSSITAESGLQYNTSHNSDTYPAFKAAISNNNTAKPSSGCSDWFLPSASQWNKMVYNQTSFLKDEMGLGNRTYWSSSEFDGDLGYSALYYSFINNQGWSEDRKNSKTHYVRSALAF